MPSPKRVHKNVSYQPQNTFDNTGGESKFLGKCTCYDFVTFHYVSFLLDFVETKVCFNQKKARFSNKNQMGFISCRHFLKVLSKKSENAYINLQVIPLYVWILLLDKDYGRYLVAFNLRLL